MAQRKKSEAWSIDRADAIKHKIIINWSREVFQEVRAAHVHAVCFGTTTSRAAAGSVTSDIELTYRLSASRPGPVDRNIAFEIFFFIRRSRSPVNENDAPTNWRRFQQASCGEIPRPLECSVFLMRPTVRKWWQSQRIMLSDNRHLIFRR